MLSQDQEAFCRSLMDFDDVADFEGRVLKVTHTEYRLSDALDAQLKPAFESHMGASC